MADGCHLRLGSLPHWFHHVQEGSEDWNGGGVFILISNDYISSDPGLSYPDDIEMVWAQLQVVGSKVINICAFYRPPNITDPMYLQALSDTITQIDTTKHRIWVAGDFNLRDIDWRTASTTPNSQYTTLCNQLIDMANDWLIPDG